MTLENTNLITLSHVNFFFSVGKYYFAKYGLLENVSSHLTQNFRSQPRVMKFRLENCL